MKLFELYETAEDNNPVPTGGTLTALGRGFVGVISQTSGNQDQYTAVQQALANHTLVTGIAETGHYILGNKAWTATPDGTWGPELSQAVNLWKRSINIQLEEAGERTRLEVDATAPSINTRDVEFLLAPLNSDGLLRQSGRDDRVQRYQGPDRLQPWEGQTFTPRLVGTIEDVDTTTRSMLDAIGWSGWYILAQAIAREKVGEDADNARWDAETVRILQGAYSSITYTPDRWYHFFRMIAIGNRQGFTIPVNGQPTPVIYTDNFAPTARDLYLFYAPIIEGLFADHNAAKEQSRDEREAALDNTAVMLDNNAIDNIVSIFRAALDDQNAVDNVLGFFGLDDASEIQMIAEGMNMLQTAADWNAVREAFNDNAQGLILEDAIFDEFPQQEYEMYFASRIQALRVVSPLLNFAAIRWQPAQEEIPVRVELDGVEVLVRVQRERASDGKIRIAGYDSYNVFEINEIVVAAVEASGGTLPDLNAPIEESSMVEAASLFIVALEASYPELTTWYAYGPPWSTEEVPDIGGLRREAIQNIMARMLQAGSADSDAIASAVVEIGRDRDWLIGTLDDPDSGVANVHFDERYQNDGIAGRLWTATRLDDEVDLSDSEEAIYEALTSTNEADRQDAIRDIMDAPDREDLYTRLYRHSIQQQTPLETLIGEGTDSVRRIINGEANTETDGVIANLANELGMPTVAPFAMAEIFQEGIGSGWDGTKEDQIMALIQRIDNRTDYELINERYITLRGVGQSLWNDIDDESADIFGDSLKAELAFRIGEDWESVAEGDLDPMISNRLDDFINSPTLENAQELERVIEQYTPRDDRAPMRAIYETLISWLEEYDEDGSVSANEWPSNYVQAFGSDYTEILEILRGPNPNVNGGLLARLEEIADIG